METIKQNQFFLDFSSCCISQTWSNLFLQSSYFCLYPATEGHKGRSQEAQRASSYIEVGPRRGPRLPVNYILKFVFSEIDLDVDDDLRQGVRGRGAGVEITPPPTFLCQHHLNHSNHLPNHSDRLNSDTLRMMIARTAGFMLDYYCNYKLCVWSQ